jgi:hypothetical protein
MAAKSLDPNSEKGGVNLAKNSKLDPPVGKIGLGPEDFLDNPKVYVKELEVPFPKLNSPIL